MIQCLCFVYATYCPYLSVSMHHVHTHTTTRNALFEVTAHTISSMHTLLLTLTISITSKQAYIVSYTLHAIARQVDMVRVQF